MSPHRVSQRFPGRPDRWSQLLTSALLLATLASHAGAAELRFTTENDLLGRNPTPDDLYTFSVAFEVDRGPLTFSMRENAFTDRAAQVRFDETYLTVGRAVPGLGTWSAYAELGAAHVGRGLLGEGVQNTVHRLIGDDEVELPYEGSSLHPYVALSGDRSFAVGRRLEVGPRLEADSVPGLRTLALAGAQARWQLRAGVALHLLLGARWSHASFGPLEPHLDGLAAAARVGVVLRDRIFITWSSNDYGDQREHWSVGYRLTPLGAGGRRASESR